MKLRDKDKMVTGPVERIMHCTSPGLALVFSAAVLQYAGHSTLATIVILQVVIGSTINAWRLSK